MTDCGLFDPRTENWTYLMCLFTWLLNWKHKETHFIQCPWLRSCQKHSRCSTLGGRRSVCSTESTLESRWKQERERESELLCLRFLFMHEQSETQNKKLKWQEHLCYFSISVHFALIIKADFGVVAFSFSTLFEAQNIFQSPGEQKWCLSYLKNSSKCYISYLQQCAGCKVRRLEGFLVDTVDKICCKFSERCEVAGNIGVISAAQCQ